MEAWQKGLSAGLIFGVFALVTMLPLPFPDPRQKRQAIDALAEQVLESVADLAGFASVVERCCQPRDQTQTAIRRFQEYRAAVGAGVGDVERGSEGLPEEIREQQTVCRGRMRHAKTSVRGRSWCRQPLSTTRGSSCSLRFANNPG